MPLSGKLGPLSASTLPAAISVAAGVYSKLSPRSAPFGLLGVVLSFASSFGRPPYTIASPSIRKMKALRTWSIRALARQQHLPGRQRPWLRERRSYSALLQSTQKASSFGYGAVGILIGTTSATAAGLRDWFGETGAQSSPERQSVVPTSQRYADVKTTMRVGEEWRLGPGRFAQKR